MRQTDQWKKGSPQINQHTEHLFYASTQFSGERKFFPRNGEITIEFKYGKQNGKLACSLYQLNQLKLDHRPKYKASKRKNCIILSVIHDRPIFIY